jgi:hypothetical protein
MNCVPSGFFVKNHVVHIEGKELYVSRGFDAQFPDPSTSDPEQWLHQESAIRKMVCCLGPSERLQAVLYTGNNFGADMDRYDAISRDCSPKICQEVRNELSGRFRERIADETLIKCSVRLYLSTKLKMRRSGFEEVLKVVERTFGERGSYFDSVLRPLGGSVTPLYDYDHYLDCLRNWSPGQVRNPPTEIDYSRSIETLCRYSEIAPRPENERGFYLDGYYVGLWVIRMMPRQTWPKTMQSFLNLTIPGLRVCVNMFPLSVAEEIRYETKRDEKLAKNVDLESRLGREKHESRGRRLMTNEVVPFQAQIIVTLYARTQEKLDNQMEGLRLAIDHSGAQGFLPALAMSSVAYFNCTTPGFGPWTGYGYSHKIDDRNLSHMWPAGSTPSAQLAEADWIACGNQNNLIGGKLFIGSQPADLLCMGSKGSGKSATLQTLLLQAAHQFKVIYILDEGFSWLETCRLLDPESRPIVVRSNSGHTFNLFDTRGLALSPQHLRSAAALAQLLAGGSSDKDREADCNAILSRTIKAIYERSYRFWKNDHPDLDYLASRRAALALRLKEDFVDAVQTLKEWEGSDKLAEMENGLTEEASAAISRDPATEHFVRDVAFSTWTPEMFPTLRDLWDEIRVQKLQAGASALYEPLANRLEVWLRDGEFGPIADGCSNVSLGSSYVTEESPLRVVHFELGEMKQAESTSLKSVVGFLIMNEVRSIVQTMPRRIRKAFLIEEMTSFLRVPNASTIVIDYAERARKYSLWLAYVFQQYSSLLKADPAVAEAIIGNAQTMLLLRNINREDLAVLDSHVHLPEPIISALQTFPMPELMKGRDDAYAGFVYVQRSDARPVFTIGRNVISPRMKRIVSSSGDDFDRKRKELCG